MRFTYTYRSSDGQRHLAEIEAENRDAAYVAIRRELGVKPIKVVAADVPPAESAEAQRESEAPSGARRALLLLAVGLALALAGGGAWLLHATGKGQPSQPQGEYRQETRDAFLKLIERAGALEDRCRAELKLLKLDNLHNYAWIERVRDVSPLYRELEKAQSIIDYTRSQSKELFKDIYRQFPPTSAHERTDAQKRYGKLMEALDIEEDRWHAENLMLLLLDGNRDAWRVEGGRIVFANGKLEEDFRFYLQPVDGATTRWKRDFGDDKAVEK